MRKLHSLALVLVLSVLVSAVSGPLLLVAAAPPSATSPTLGDAASYSVLAGSIVTNTGLTTMPGDLGISPSIGVAPHYSNFPPGVVGPPGTIHDADAHAAAAQADNTTAFGALDQGCDVTYLGVQDLTLVTPLVAGVYCADAFLLTGNLTLSGSGVWIFKSAATLTTSSNSSVTASDPCSVWWRLASSGVLGTGTSFVGNILALTSITLQTGATLDGRALAQTGQVSLDANALTGPPCAPAPTATSTSTSTAVSTSTSTSTQTVVPSTSTNTPTATPTTLANTATATSTSTPTALLNTATATRTPTATGTLNTPTSTSTATATPTGTLNTPTSTSTATATPTGTLNTPTPGSAISTVTPTAAAQATTTPAATALSTPTATVPAVVGLPATGGGPLAVQTFSWGGVLLLLGLGALALAVGAAVRSIFLRRGR